MTFERVILMLACTCALTAASHAQQTRTIDAKRMLEDYYQDSFGLASDPGARIYEELSRTWLLAKARPDECYSGIGGVPSPAPCPDSALEKTNEAYVWGMTKSGSRLWFGTAPNVHCLVMGGTSA